MSRLKTATPVAFALTADRKAATAFYTGVLGFSLVAEDPFADVLAMNGAILRVVQIDDYKAGPHPTLGWDVEDIVATVRDLNAKGVTMTIYEGYGQDAMGIWTAPDGKAKVCWFNDPDGNVLSLAQH